MMTSISSINTNAPAMQYQSQLSRSIDKQNTSMERLSSGLKINTAKDDAAGLQISNRLLVQNRGMDVAIRNANDGISMLQTAEGAMSEYTENLTRMRDLALRHNNGSLSSEDRSAIRQEYGLLRNELSRITQTTSFGGEKLLNGESSERSFQVGADTGETIRLTMPNLDDKTDIQIVKSRKWVTQHVFYNDWQSKPGDTLSLRNFRNGEYITYATEIESGSDMYDIADYLNDKFGDILVAKIEVIQKAYEKEFKDLVIYSNDDDHGFGLYINKSRVRGGHSYPVDEEKSVSTTKQVVPTLEKEADADFVLGQIDEVLQSVDSERAKLGAIQNRLSHAINNLSQTSENVAASNSQIRDTDFAKETSELTKQSILREVNTSMLAQASNAPRSALNLLS
ncbi:flagellin [Vibrio alginolyticus]